MFYSFSCYSHDIKVGIPKELTVKCTKPTEIVITGADKQKVGQFAAEIRAEKTRTLQR